LAGLVLIGVAQLVAAAVAARTVSHLQETLQAAGLLQLMLLRVAVEVLAAALVRCQQCRCDWQSWEWD
jgi:hypothetical protein